MNIYSDFKSNHYFIEDLKQWWQGECHDDDDVDVVVVVVVVDDDVRKAVTREPRMEKQTKQGQVGQ